MMDLVPLQEETVGLQGHQTSQSLRKSGLEGLMLKLKLQVWPPDVKNWLLEKLLMLGKIEYSRIRGWQRMKWLDSITDSMDMDLNKLQEMVRDRGAWHAVVRVAKSWAWLSNWTRRGHRGLLSCSLSPLSEDMARRWQSLSREESPQWKLTTLVSWSQTSSL